MALNVMEAREWLGGPPQSYELGYNQGFPVLEADTTRKMEYKTFSDAKAALRRLAVDEAHQLLGIVRLLDRVQSWEHYELLTIHHGFAGPADPDHEAWKDPWLAYSDGKGGQAAVDEDAPAGDAG